MLTFGPGAAVEHMPKCQVFAVIKFESRMIFSGIKMSPGIGFFWHRTDAIQKKIKGNFDPALIEIRPKIGFSALFLRALYIFKPVYNLPNLH